MTPAFSALDPAPYTGSGALTLETFSDEELAATFAVSYRRALAFPLFRSFALAEACRADVVSFLAGGKRLVLRCLLELKAILDHHDVYYIYSKVWVDDLCLWVQAYARRVDVTNSAVLGLNSFAFSDEIFNALTSALSRLKIPKSLIEWNLEELDALVNDNTSHSSDSDDDSVGEVERMLPAQL